MYGRSGFTFRMRYKRLRPHTSCAGYYKTIVARPSNIHIRTLDVPAYIQEECALARPTSVKRPTWQLLTTHICNVPLVTSREDAGCPGIRDEGKVNTNTFRLSQELVYFLTSHSPSLRAIWHMRKSSAIGRVSADYCQ